MRITNYANLPASIVRAVENDPYPHGQVGDISVTRLVGPPQIRILEQAHWDDIEEDAADRLWSLWGQVAHGVLERADVDAITEERMFAHVLGWDVSGQFDRLTMDDDAALQDYKMTSVWAVMHGIKPEWVAQLNVLAWLLFVNGYTVPARLEIIALLRDWRRSEARESYAYPRKAVAVIPVDQWGMNRTRDYVHERVRIHQDAIADHQAGKPYPECTREERWQKPPKFAVRKPGRSSAVAVFDTEEEAEELVRAKPGHFVEFRQSRPVRCEEHCSVARFCAQRASVCQPEPVKAQTSERI